MVWSTGESFVGWWKDGNLCGNSRKFLKDGGLQVEGWFGDQHSKVGPFQKSSDLYKYWDMNDGYFINR